MRPAVSEDVVFVAYPLRNGAQALMPRRVEPRSCVRLDGHAKIGYRDRADARHGCPKHETVYRCTFCARWHRATKRGSIPAGRPAPVAWVRRRAA